MEKDWDGTQPLYSVQLDKYFWSLDELLKSSHPAIYGSDSSDLRLCEPVYFDEINPDEHYIDILPEDEEVPNEIYDAFEELNKKIREYKAAASWQPGEYKPTTQSLKKWLSTPIKEG